MDSRFSFLRHEKLARLAEQRLSHPHVRSRHEPAILSALEKDGHFEAAASLREAMELDPGQAHREAFSRGTHQRAKRLGADPAVARAMVQAAWKTTLDWAGFVGSLEAEGFRVAEGDKAKTLVVETTNGVFVGALHRLARVRKIDLDRRRTANERNEANECERGLGGNPHGRSEHPERPIDSNVGRSAVDRSGNRDSVVNSDRASGTADEPGTASPPPGCGFQGRAGCISLRLRLRRLPSATERLLARARDVAMPASARVGLQIDARDAEIAGELESRLALTISFPPLDVARQEYSGAVSARKKIANLLVRQSERREKWLKCQPTGFGTLFNNSKRVWSAKLAEIDKVIANLSVRQDAAWETQQRLKAVITDLERQLRNQQHALANSADHQEKIASLRREQKKIAAARDLLAKNPMLAFGGFLLVMLLAVIRDVLDRQPGQRLGGSQFGLS